MSATPFLETLEKRRTIYSLNKKSSVSDARIQEIIKHAILHVPSAFNCQTTRIVLLLKEEHEKLWEIVKDILKDIVPPKAFSVTEKKINGFKAGYGTILFFDDNATIRQYQEKYATYADKFEGWSQEADAMHQYAIWTALETEGLGANLQHYNPLIDQKVASTWGLPEAWQLRSQMVFGGIGAPAGEKSFLPVDGERFRVFGA